MFNRYSDNIYYTDPNKANIYLAGGALPDSQQTQRYLLRNDIITDMGNVREDFESLTANNIIDDQMYADMKDDIRELEEALCGYFENTNPDELKIARDLLRTGRTL